MVVEFISVVLGGTVLFVRGADVESSVVGFESEKCLIWVLLGLEDEGNEAVEENVEDGEDWDKLEEEVPGALEDPGVCCSEACDVSFWPEVSARATCASKSTKYSFKTSARRPCPCPISART